MQRLFAFLVCATGFAALLLAGLLWSIPRIEDDLTARAKQDLAATGASDLDVVFDGRNGSVSGSGATLATERLDTNLRGARWVRFDGLAKSDTTTAPATTSTTSPQGATTSPPEADKGAIDEPAATEAASLRLSRDGRAIVLAGSVASEDDRVLIIREILSAGYEVDDRLTVDPAVEPTLTVAAAAPLIRPLLTGSIDGDLTIDDERVLVTGTADNPVAAEEIEAAASIARTNGAAVEVDLDLLELSEDEQVVALQDEFDQIFELARRIQTESPNFGTNQDDLNQSAVNILERVALAMRRYPLPDVTILGHTDARGSVASNQRLSVERAATVLDYLVSANVDHQRLVTEGRSEFEPIASNGTNEGRQENRRVNFVVTKRVS